MVSLGWVVLFFKLRGSQFNTLLQTQTAKLLKEAIQFTPTKGLTNENTKKTKQFLNKNTIRMCWSDFTTPLHPTKQLKDPRIP